MDIHFVSFIGLAPGAEREDKYLGKIDDLITRQRVLSDSAINKGEVNYTHLFNREMLLETPYYQTNKALLDQSRGCGFWAWKPYVILQTLAKTKPGDYVIYCDVGKPNEKSKVDHGNIITTSLKPLVEWAERHDGMLAGVYLSNHGAAKHWIKRDCFLLMECDEKRYHDMPTIQAGYTVWKNTPDVINFLEKWQKLNLDPRLISDQKNTLGHANYPGFQRNCHDQATLTLLCEKQGVSVFGGRKNQFLGFRNINFVSHEAAYQNALSDGQLILKEINHSNPILPSYCVRWVELLFAYRRYENLNIGIVCDTNDELKKVWQEYFPNAKIEINTLELLNQKEAVYDLLLAMTIPENSFTNELLVNSYQSLTLEGAFFIAPIPNEIEGVKSEFELTARKISSDGCFVNKADFHQLGHSPVMPKISNSRNPIFLSGKSNEGHLESVCIMIKPSEGVERD